MVNQTVDFKDPPLVIEWLDAALKKEKKKYKQCPVRSDGVPDYESAQGWGYVVAGYFLAEASFKAFLYVRGKQVPRIHSLSPLFDRFEEEDKTILREYYTDYQATIGGRVGAFPFESLDDFLRNLDGDKNKRGDHIGSFDWRYFLIEEKRSQRMPVVSMDYLHEIVCGCIQIIRYANNSSFEPCRHTHSWRMRRKREAKYRDWLNVRLNSDGWDDLGDRLEILWGADYRGRYDLCLFKGKERKDYFSKIPDNFTLPVVDKRKDIEHLLRC